VALPSGFIATVMFVSVALKISCYFKSLLLINAIDEAGVGFIRAGAISISSLHREKHEDTQVPNLALHP
jgi:hypothetical protein